jgi:hypothetical protein
MKGGPRVNSGWSEDLSYGYFRRIIGILKADFDLIQMRDAPDRNPAKAPHAIVRHDLDVSLDAGLRMARLEHELDVRATYLLLLNSPFYEIDSPASRAKVREFVALGHEVGVHFDIGDHPGEHDWSLDVLEHHVSAAADRLSEVAGEPVRSFSFHRPIPQFLHGQTYIAGLVNAYAADLMQWYISDSKGNWREGEPLPQLRAPRANLLQILIHPIWWDERHLPCEDRLDLFREELLTQRPNETREALDEALWDVLVVRPRART